MDFAFRQIYSPINLSEKPFRENGRIPPQPYSLFPDSVRYPLYSHFTNTPKTTANNIKATFSDPSVENESLRRIVEITYPEFRTS